MRGERELGRKIIVMAAAGVASVLAGGAMPAAAATAQATVTQVPCSTPALVSAVSGAAAGTTLSLAGACTYVLTAALPTVGQDLTINGNGATLTRSTATGTAAFTILTITAGTVTLNRLSFTNGNGAIAVDGLAQLTVTGGVFSGNTAVNGAAIDNTGSTVVQVNGASFTDNKASGDGGAMYVYTALGDQITDCQFAGNTAGSGGAYWEWSNGTAISGSVFRSNTAMTGGAMYFDDQGSVITGTLVAGNTATGDGGGIYDSPGGGPVGITDSTIAGNHAGGAGGGLDEESPGLPGSVAYTTIADNSAADGGGINDGDGVYIEYTSDIIAGNHARGDGGGVYNQGSFAASSTRIAGNRAAGGGGGIYDDGTQATVTLTDSSPAGNRPDNCEPLNSIAGCTG
jgi:polymorphic membrane protein